jgi:hypothetical protein
MPWVASLLALRSSRMRRYWWLRQRWSQQWNTT